MQNQSHTVNISKLSILIYSLVFLFFLQLVSDFIEAIYTFGLLGTDIPPEIISVVFFFSPVLLISFRRGLPARALPWLMGSIGVARALAVSLDTTNRMLISGVGVGLFFLFLPSLFANQSVRKIKASSIELGIGLTLTLALSISLRLLGAGTDLSFIYPWISWVLAALLLVSLLIYRQPSPVSATGEHKKAKTGTLMLLILGITSSLLTLYFTFSSPLVLGRWSGVDARVVITLVALALILFSIALGCNRLEKPSKSTVILWNLLFWVSGVSAILINQVPFPNDPGVFPIYQPEITLWQQTPFFIFLLLHPIVIVNFIFLARDLAGREPSSRQLAVGTLIGSTFFLLIVLAQAFTTVYDYIPVIGPWFRDRFWLIFTAAALGSLIPSLTLHKNFKPPEYKPAPIFTVLICIFLIGGTAWVFIREPAPQSPPSSEVVRVLTFNIQQGYDSVGSRNYQGQLELIRSLDADIIGLQESDTARFSGGNADLVRTINDGLQMYSYYGPRTVTGTFGIALLSRYPIENPRTFYMYSAGEQTAAIEAQITINGRQFHVLVTHLGNGGPLIQQQQVLAALAGKHDVIAMGDFNFEMDTEQYALTTQTYASAWMTAGLQLPPGLEKEDLIDHIFLSDWQSLRMAEYIDSPASDHPALLVEIIP